MREVFISYKSQETAPDSIDETVAKELCQALEAAGITCWMAPRNIPAGSHYADEIVYAIENCRVFLVVFSKLADKSVWISDEVRIGYENHKMMCSFNIDGTQYEKKWKIYLGGSQLIDARGDYRLKIPELIVDFRLKLRDDKNGQDTNSIDIDAPIKSNTIPVTPDVLDFTVNGVSFNMVRVDGGTFMMGATLEQAEDALDDEKPPHQVTLSTYYIGKTQVTQELWQSIMGNNPSWFKDDLQCPVECVTWNKCQVFIGKLNQMTGNRFRLPTEAEWEFAARGGNKSKGFKYAGGNNLDEVAWYRDNSSDHTHPVAKKKANELGLYDMSGNVLEWCQDRRGSYWANPQTDPTGPQKGFSCITRGGSCLFHDFKCRVSYRDMNFRWNPNIDLGFRLALDL